MLSAAVPRGGDTRGMQDFSKQLARIICCRSDSVDSVDWLQQQPKLCAVIRSVRSTIDVRNLEGWY